MNKQNTMETTVIKKRLEGQVALVTGANSGIGQGIALQLARDGARVVINYVSHADRAEALVADIKRAGGDAIAVEADVGDEGQVQSLFRQACASYGTVDILVNNAGIQQDAAIDEMTLEQWDRVLRVNLTGQFLCAREAVREFKRRGIVPEISRAAGKIIGISSVHEVIPWAGHINYAASKGGVMLMNKTLAQEVAPHRIRVNEVCPGAIRTPINRAAWEAPEAYAKLLQLIPWQRIGEPEDVAKAVAWLVSDEADYVHGASIFVDGGMTLYPGFSAGG